MSAAVILAAGAGRRLGGVAKALIRLPDGRSYLEAVRDTAEAAGIRAFVVVVGPPHEQVTSDEASRLGLVFVSNKNPARGMSSSVALGFAYCLDHFGDSDAALLWPVDHPLVQRATVCTIIARSSADGAVIPTYRGRGGHPSAFGRAVWPALAACASAPHGARTVIRGLQERAGKGADGLVDRIEVSDRGTIADVDTRRELAEHGGSPNPPSDTERRARGMPST